MISLANPRTPSSTQPTPEQQAFLDSLTPEARALLEVTAGIRKLDLKMWPHEPIAAGGGLEDEVLSPGKR